MTRCYQQDFSESFFDLLILLYDAVISKKKAATKVEERCGPLHIPHYIEEEWYACSACYQKKNCHCRVHPLAAEEAPAVRSPGDA